LIVAIPVDADGEGAVAGDIVDALPGPDVLSNISISVCMPSQTPVPVAAEHS